MLGIIVRPAIQMEIRLVMEESLLEEMAWERDPAMDMEVTEPESIHRAEVRRGYGLHQETLMADALRLKWIPDHVLARHREILPGSRALQIIRDAPFLLQVIKIT
jgi:hypothetical protein